MQSWLSLQVRKCIDLPELSHTFNVDSAKQYYDDTLTCLHDSIEKSSNPRRRNQRGFEAGAFAQSSQNGILDTNRVLGSETNDLVEILVEFSEASLLDLEIKQEAFRSREIFIVMQSLIKLQLTDEFKLNLDENEEEIVSSGEVALPGNGQNGNQNPHEDEQDIQNKLRNTMLSRCFIMHNALRVISSILFSSDCIKCRIGIVSGIR